MKRKGFAALLIALLALLGAAAIAVGVWGIPELFAPSDPDDQTPATEAGHDETAPTASALAAAAQNGLTDADKVRYNTAIHDNIVRALRKTLYSTWGKEELSYHTNYLASAETKAQFAWEIVLLDQEIERIYDLDADGETATGAVSFRETDYVAAYEKLYHESADVEALLRAGFRLKEERLYGYRATGWGPDPFVLKTTDVVYNNESGCYEVRLDMLAAFCETEQDGEVHLTTDYEALYAYEAASVLAYPAELVHAKLVLELEPHEESYVLKALRFEPR